MLGDAEHLQTHMTTRCSAAMIARRYAENVAVARGVNVTGLTSSASARELSAPSSPSHNRPPTRPGGEPGTRSAGLT